MRRKDINTELESIYVNDESLDTIINELVAMRSKYMMKYSNLHIEEVSDYYNSHHHAIFGSRVETDDEMEKRQMEENRYIGMRENQEIEQLKLLAKKYPTIAKEIR